MADALIASIDSEIAELENLIDLQRGKVELLAKKRAALSSIVLNSLTEAGNVPAIADDNADSRVSYHKDQGIELYMYRASNPLLGKDAAAAAAATADTTAASDAVSTATAAAASSDAATPAEVKNSADAVKKLKAEELSASSMTHTEKQQQEMFNAVQRMSRLTTDLANERNLLAWGRTALAAARTSLAFLGVGGLSLFGDVSQQIATIAFMVVALVTVMHAVHRYKKIKFILMQPEPPLHFDRLSNVPLYVVLMILLLLALIAIASQQWS